MNCWKIPSPARRAARSGRAEPTARASPPARARSSPRSPRALGRHPLADRGENFSRLFVSAREREPARASRKNRARPRRVRAPARRREEHPAPTVDRRERVVDEVGKEDADRDRKLEQRDKAAAAAFRRDLRDIDRDDRRGQPDRNPENRAPGDQHVDAGGARGNVVPTMKTTAEAAISTLRPIRSPISIAAPAPITAPTSTALTTTL